MNVIVRRDAKRCQPFISSFHMHTSPLSFDTFCFFSSRLSSPLPLRCATMPMPYYAARYPSFSSSSPHAFNYNYSYTFFRVTGKSKKPPAVPPPAPSPSPSPSPSPPRITSNVKYNLKLLKSLKGFRQSEPAPAPPRPSSRYRRKRVPKEDPAQDDTHLLYQDPDSILYRTDWHLHTGVPVLLVDGYNVCGYWPKLKKHFHGGRLDIAREMLIDELVSFSSVRDMKVVVVFDATGSGLPTHKESFAGVDIVYSGESSADAWIEKEVVTLRKVGRQKVRVATSDLMQQQATHGAGAFVWSCKALISEIKAAEEEMKMALQEQRPTFEGRLLKHNLDAKVVDALKELRKKLAENEAKDKRSRK